jgi:hypothetical protein
MRAAVPRRGLALSLLGFIALASPLARADGDAVSDCIAASDQGLELRKQGKLLEARHVLAACAAPACGAQISDVCRKRIADISATLPSIVFLPKDASGGDVVGARVTIDGATEAQVLDGRAVSLDPGVHTFRFEATGVPPAERSFVLVEGAHDRQERIDLVAPASVPAPHAAAPASVAPTTPAAMPSSGSSQRTIAFIVGGVGILGVGAGSVLGLMATSQWSASKSDCASSQDCPRRPSAVTEHDTASTEATLSTVAFIVGGAALATSAVLFLTAPSSSATGSSGVPLRLEASLAPGGGGLALAGGFR